MKFPVSAITLALTVLAIGSPAPAAEPMPLRAGPLTMLFDTEIAFLRYVKAGPHEVLRGINAPIRNDVWGTVVPQVSNVVLDHDDDHFSLTFDAVCQEPGIDFRWKGTLTGSPDGTVVFEFDGVAHSTFQKNRIGFCILHGPSAAGQAWEIEHADGRKDPGGFPALISPHQPAMQIRAISHDVAPGIRAHVRMEGDTWEMEDQRNWTDASFKTYCTPLEIPYPVEITAGTRIRQKVRLHVDGDIPTDFEPADVVTIDRTTAVESSRTTSLPRLGLQVSSESRSLTELQIERLEALRLDHLRIDLDLTDQAYPNQLGAAARQADQLDVNLHLGIRTSDQPESELQRLADILAVCPVRVSALLYLEATEQQYHAALEILMSDQHPVLIATGYDTNFVELNRDRPSTEQLQAVTWAINPQIHAFDNASIVETLPIHATTLETARAFRGDNHAIPMLVGPITLRPQQISREPLPGVLPSDVDRRQSSLFAAAWTVGSLHQLARGQAHSATLFETTGWKGIMDLDQQHNRPGNFPTTPGEVYPVYHVLRALADFTAGDVISLSSSDPLSADALMITDGDRTRTIAANFTDRAQRIHLRTDHGETLRLLDADSLPMANSNPQDWLRQPGVTFDATQPLLLPAHAIAVIDGRTR